MVLVSLLVLAGLAGGGACAQSNSPSGGTGGLGTGGTGGSSGSRCTGTARACAGLDDFDCATTAGCLHTGVCQGMPLDCASLSATGCAKQPGCMLAPGVCSGFPQDCFNFFSQQQCTQVKGCFWDANNFFCSGTATPCQSIPADMCTFQQGCSLSVPTNCSGLPASCTTFMGKDDCNSEIGCLWVSNCSGTPTACETFSETDCMYQPGCTCEGCGTMSSSSAGGAPPCVLASDCDPTVDPCRTGDCINGECIQVPNCKPCAKQIECDPKIQPCFTGNCIDQKCQAVDGCQICTVPEDCDKAVNKCFIGTCTAGACDIMTQCIGGDGCCPPGCKGMDVDCF